MAFPTTGVLDNFNRTDAATLGANWTADILAAGYGSWAVASNTADATGFDSNWWNVSSFGPDSEAFVTVVTAPTASLRLYINIQSAGSSGMDAYELSFGPTSAFILRMDNGTRTQLSSLGSGVANGDKVGLENIGDTLQAYKDTGSGWAAWGSAVAGGGSFGAGHIGIWAQNDNAAFLDDFGGGTVVTAGGVVVKQFAALGVG